MGSEELTIEEKCDNLMNIVVDCRKRFRPKCTEYEQKSSLMENKILNLHLETISKYHFKPKNPIPRFEIENDIKDMENFTKEILEKQQRIDSLKTNLKNIQPVILQLKTDDTSMKAREALSAEALLTRAKNKKL